MSGFWLGLVSRAQNPLLEREGVPKSGQEPLVLLTDLLFGYLDPQLLREWIRAACQEGVPRQLPPFAGAQGPAGKF